MNEKTQKYKKENYKDFGAQPDLLEIKLGCNLISLAEEEEDKRSPLLEEIIWLRNQLDDELGLVLPMVRVRDSIFLKPDEYSLFLNGTEVAKSSVKIGYYLCMDTGSVSNPLDNMKWEKTKDPAFEMDGFIIPENEVKKAKEAGYVCASPEKMIRVHFYEVIRKNITRILNQSLVNELVEKVRKINPDVITDVFFTQRFSISKMKILLNRLLEERVSIRDMNTILETIADYLVEEQKPLLLAEKVRERLAPGFIKEYEDENNIIHVFRLSQSFSEYLADHVYYPESKVDKPYLAIDPSDRKRLYESINKCASLAAEQDFPIVFVCVSTIRALFSDYVREVYPSAHVISDMELCPIKDDLNITVEKEVDFEDK